MVWVPMFASDERLVCVGGRPSYRAVFTIKQLEVHVLIVRRV